MKFSLSEFAQEQNYQVESMESIDSTNRLAMEYAKTKNADKLWVVAEEQTKGRARRGRAWSSPKGNLYASLALISGIKAESAANLGFVAGISMAEAINAIIDEYASGDVKNCDFSKNTNDLVKLKWPNDLLLKGAKASGILLELAKLKHDDYALVIGVGLNVAHHYEDAPYPTQSLHRLGINIDATTVFTKLSHYFAINFLLFQTENGAQIIRDKWLQYAAFLGQFITIITENAKFTGVFTGLDEDFNCIIRDEHQKEIKISAGDVHFGAVASQASTLY